METRGNEEGAVGFGVESRSVDACYRQHGVIISPLFLHKYHAANPLQYLNLSHPFQLRSMRMMGILPELNLVILLEYSLEHTFGCLN
jgi:hypothetical protein